MKIGKLLIIVVGAMGILLGALHYFGGTAPENGGKNNGLPPVVDPAIKEAKNRIDDAGEITKWDLSGTEEVKGRLEELDMIREQIESDYLGGRIKKEEDKVMMIRYYNDMLAEQLDRAIFQFFANASYDDRSVLYPLYSTYRNMPQRNNEGSAFPIALHYYIVGDVLRKDVGNNIDTITLEDAELYLKKIQKASSFERLAKSQVFQVLKKKTEQEIDKKTLATYRRAKNRVFDLEFDDGTFGDLRAEITKLQNSEVGKSAAVKSFLYETGDELTLFRDCAVLLNNQDTLTLCQLCKPYTFYGAICK